MSFRDMGSGVIMANGQNQNQMQGQQDVSPQEQEKLTEHFENMIINDWIQKEQKLSFDVDDIDSPYANYTTSKKHSLDQEAFKYYNDLYMENITSVENGPQITFENFVLLWNPEKDFKYDLLNFSMGSKETPATIWQGEYNSNTDLYKKSAIEGYKINLIELGAAQQLGESEPS